MKKKMKLLFLIMLSVVFTFGVIGCNSTNSNDAEAESTYEFKIGIVLGEGGANDQSFNQSSLEGFDKAKENLGVIGNYLEANQEADYKPNIETFIDQDVDLVIGVGYTTAKAMLEAAQIYEDRNFVIIDHNYEEEGKEIPQNMACVTFDEREVAYLVGLIASNMTETNKVGFIGGMKDPNITRFEEGFKKGVKDGKEGVDLLSQYANSYDDASLGKSIANQMYSKNIDIIFSAAGNVGTGAIESAKEQNKYAIGVDMDQNSLAPNNVITSAMKRVDIGVYDIIEQAKEGKFKGGQVTVYGLKEGGVGIAPTTDINVPSEVLDIIKEQQDRIVNGEIKIN
ncbi:MULTISPECIES: BMP family lipoprotein [unclassified Romboutsia]|uniref:BMP family lipoprotein n=1 Tax=unclassified Romboutsia TaxID=2626894 RepID=UPI000F05EAF9|nr:MULTISPECIES: BMP family ABC transporter substrate-binding protein [unclassified Romboutsia]